LPESAADPHAVSHSTDVVIEFYFALNDICSIHSVSLIRIGAVVEVEPEVWSVITVLKPIFYPHVENSPRFQIVSG